MSKDELIIQLVKVALGILIGGYFLWWSLEVLKRLPPRISPRDRSALPAVGRRYSARANSSRTACRPPLRRARHRQRHCRRHRPCRGRFSARAGHAQGRHGADRRSRARARSTTPWGRRSESSGGSAANTIVGVASLGARAAFVGKVKDDELGRAFAHDIRAAGVAFDTSRRAAGRRPRAATSW